MKLVLTFLGVLLLTLKSVSAQGNATASYVQCDQYTPHSVFPPITDLRTGTPLTLVDTLQVNTDCSPYAWTDTLTALLSNTAHAASPVTISVVPYTTFPVTFVFTDLPVTLLKPGDVMTLVGQSLLASNIAITWGTWSVPSTAMTATPTSTTFATITVKPTTAAVTPNPSSGEGGSSTPTGAIVGGAVGGVAAIAGIAALAFIFIRRSRRKTNRATHMAERSDSIPVVPRHSQLPKPELFPSSDVTEPNTPDIEMPSARLRYPGE